MENKLREIRKNKKLTQVEVGKILGMTQSTYQTYENDRAVPSIDNLIKLADYYHVSLDYLVGRVWRDEIGYLTPEQRECVEDIKRLTEINLFKATAYVKGLIAGQEEKQR